MPILITTPDMTAETWLGAEACADGSHECNGITPALMPNARSASRKSAVPAGECAGAEIQPKPSSPPTCRSSRKKANSPRIET